MSDRLLKESDVLKAIDKRVEELSKDPVFIRKNGIIDVMGVKKHILAIPSADRPQGEWKPKNHHTDYCSNCGFEETQWRTADYNFCPSCGARMKGVDDEHTV